MNKRIQIDWVEQRKQGSESHLFFVEATEASPGWSFMERETWEVRWHATPATARLSLIAERGRSAALSGSLGGEGDLCVAAVGVSTSELWLGPRTERPAGPQLSVIAIVRYREHRWIPAHESEWSEAEGSGRAAYLAASAVSGGLATP